MKRRGANWLEATLALAVFVGLGGVIYPVFQRSQNNKYRALCQTNLQHIGRAMSLYAQDHADHLPLVGSNGTAYGWADTLLPYSSILPSSKMTALYHCPSYSSPSQTEYLTPQQRNYTDYWFSSSLSARALMSVNALSSTLLMGEGNDGRDATTARYALNRLRQQWLTDQNSPAYRHLDGMNCLFADGRVKWTPPQNIVASPRDGLTFVLK